MQVLISLLGMAPSHEDAQALKGFACLRELRRAAVEHDADTAPVGFPPGGDAEQTAERVWHTQIVRQNRVCCNSGAFNEKTGDNWLVP